MKIEVLFPEFCNLYGDMWNVRYLEKCSEKIEIINTPLKGELAFLNGDIDMIYMGPMSEKTQEKVIKKLMPYKEKLEEFIEQGKIVLFTGNAFEILGKYIEDEDNKIEALGLFDIYSKREMLNRYDGMLLGEFNGFKMLGFKNQFSQSYGENKDKYFIEVKKGIGLNPSSKLEGIHYKNFFGTYLLGPILILNPLFTKYLLEQLGLKDFVLKFEDEIMDVYNKRLEDFERLDF